MRIELLDVGHGQCIFVVADNGHTMLFDCGHDNDTGFRPSEYLPRLGHRQIQHFFITNYDEDHISDLPALQRDVQLQLLYRNRSVEHQHLRGMKAKVGYISGAMEALLGMMGSYTGSVTSPPDLPGIEFSTYCNWYPHHFDDTNNLSLVTFLHYGNIHMVIPGDLETAGWRKLLEQDAFRAELRRVNFFVASHHGRESGYCKEVFDHCRPELVLISDEEKQYATQEMVSTYGRHASGVPWPNETRRVLTTRSDGKITIFQTHPAKGATVSFEGRHPRRKAAVGY